MAGPTEDGRTSEVNAQSWQALPPSTTAAQIATSRQLSAVCPPDSAQWPRTSPTLTPQNFKRGEVSFEQVLKEAAGGRARFNNQDSLNSAASQTKLDESGAMRADGNNVDIDREMIVLADTALTYNTLTQVLATRLGIMRSVASDGRR